MAVGLYSGVSGLAVGVGLYKGVSGLWGGSSGLINGFGGSGPFPGSSLYLDFLTPPLDSRITFSRGTNATLVDSTGKITYAPNNQLLSSEDFDAAYWAKARGSITANVATAPNGTTTADLLTATSTGTYAAAFRSGFTFIGATQYIYSVYAKASVGQYLILYINETGDVGRAIFDLNSGAISSASVGTTASITPVGDGWWRCVVSATPSTTTLGIVVAGVVDSGAVTTVTSGKSILLWGAQLEQVTYQTTPGPYVATTASAYYGPRFDYDPVTLAPRGLLIEEARTNLALYSQQFDDAYWTKTQVTVTANTTVAPDGTTAADAVIPSTTNTFHDLRSTANISLAASANVLSIYVKAAGYNFVEVGVSRDGSFTGYATAVIDLTNGTNAGTGASLLWTINSVSVQNAGNGWYRVSLAFTPNTLTTLGMVFITPLPTSTRAVAFAGNGTSGIFLYGAQLEAGAFATSYIPTVASTVSRSADVATMTGTNFSSWYAATGGTFVVDYTLVGSTSASSYPFGLSNNATLTEFYGAAALGGTGTSSAYANFNSSSGAFDVNGVAASTPLKLAVALAANDRAISKNGATVVTSTTAWAVPAVARLDIGDLGGTGSYRVGRMHIRAIAYYNTRLPNTQLQTLTAPSLASPLALDFISPTYTVGY